MFKTSKEWQTFKRLLAYLLTYRWLTLLALLLLLATSAIKSIIPLLASYFIDHFLTTSNHMALTVLIGYYLLYGCQSLVEYLGNVFFSRVSYSVVRDIRQDAFTNMEKLGMAYFDKTASGQIVSQLTNDTEAISQMFSGLLASFVSAIFIFFATLYTMLQLDSRLTALVVLFLPVILLLVNRYRHYSAPIITKTRQYLGDINAKLSETIEGITIIQSFVQEARLEEEFAAINDAHYHYSRRTMAVDSLFLRPAMSLLKLLAYAVLMAYFGLNANHLGITAGIMYAFIQYINRLFDPLIEVTQNFSTLQTSMVAASRVFDLIDNKTYDPKQDETNHTIENGNISFKNVSFSYDSEQKILDDISFTVNKGETIAFVGATGSGKSSIINVLMRFYEFQAGEVLIDGCDIRQYAIAELRQQMGLVLQEAYLYHGTIRSNIAMYQELSDDEVKAAAAFVDADQFIQTLPKQYQQPVTEKGSTFSTGQRQLLAFARTIACNPKILILDEATANIDSATEHLVQESLKKMRQGRTTIAVAHRLSTIQDADCIYVLDKGKIIEHGCHEELLQLKGSYYKMYQLQTGLLG